MDSLFPNIDILSKSLDMYLLRHSLVAENIAHAETPGYKARRLEFEPQLYRLIQSEKEKEDAKSLRQDIENLVPSITEDPMSETGQDLNSVDMDREMAELTKNDIKFSFASQLVSKKFAILKYIASEGAEK